jgi:hypothetical protein
MKTNKTLVVTFIGGSTLQFVNVSTTELMLFTQWVNEPSEKDPFKTVNNKDHELFILKGTILYYQIITTEVPEMPEAPAE